MYCYDDNGRGVFIWRSGDIWTDGWQSLGRFVLATEYDHYGLYLIIYSFLEICIMRCDVTLPSSVIGIDSDEWIGTCKSKTWLSLVLVTLTYYLSQVTLNSRLKKTSVDMAHLRVVLVRQRTISVPDWSSRIKGLPTENHKRS